MDKDILKKLFCKHEFMSLGKFNKFEQSPFHQPGIGWGSVVVIQECCKCKKRKEITLK